MMRSFKIISLLSLTLFMCGCFSPTSSSSEHGLQSFDISPDGKTIIYSWIIGKKMNLYSSRIDGKISHPLFGVNNVRSFYNPKFSFDGRRIIFLGRPHDSYNSALWISKINGDSLTRLTDEKTIKTEAIFSIDDKVIYFAQATEYGAYSPIARKAAHNFDIYSISLRNYAISKISNFKAYHLSHLSDIDDSRLLMKILDEDQGIFFYNKHTSILNKISIKNDTLGYSEIYSKPIMINDSTLVCSSTYVLVNINLKTRIQSVILPSNGSSFQVVRYNKQLRKIFFQRENDKKFIHSMNLDGSNLTDIELSVR